MTTHPHHDARTPLSGVPLLLRRALARVRQAAARRRHARATMRFAVRARDTLVPAPVVVRPRAPRPRS
jgi:hypothetical protein